MNYRTKYFRIEELVSPQTFKDRGEKAWELLDNRLLVTLDELRERYGPMTINNWYWGGERKWSGLRTPESPWYSQYSQHTFGRAADILFADTTVDQVRQDIVDDSKQFRHDEIYSFITAVEDDVSWLHIDVRNCPRLKLFKP